ncbi:MAG: hypothetical protein IPO42_16430 [Chitinophagaceae bacterium]|nr:hypothetical protein [Chitinophagaceae bacterium]
MWPVADAFNNNFEATPPAILLRLKNNEGFSLSSSINSYLKSTWLQILAPFTSSRTERAANA